MKRILLILFVLLVLLGGGGAAAWVFFGKQIETQLAGKSLFGFTPFPAKPSAVPTAPPAPAFYPSLTTAPTPIPAANIYRMPQLMGTIFDTDNHPYSVRIHLEFILHAPGDVDLVQNYLPRVRDALETYLHDDIRFDRAHPVDIDQVRRDLVPRLNAVVQPAKLTDILVDEFVIQ